MMRNVFTLFGLWCTVGFALMLLALNYVLQPSPEARRLRELLHVLRPEGRTVSGSERIEEVALVFSQWLRRILRLRVSTKARERLLAAGYRHPAAPDALLAALCVMPLLGIIVGSFVPWSTSFVCFVFAVAGFLLPDLFVSWKLARRQRRLLRSLPDVLDLLVICMDAGLGMDQAVLRVTEELSLSHSEINEELRRVQLEQSAGGPRLEAWNNLATRTRVDEFRAFAAMLGQTERFGAPISRALSRFAEEMRTKRRQHTEQAAAKSKVKIVFPLVMFILPCLFIVLLGPAILNLHTALAQMTR